MLIGLRNVFKIQNLDQIDNLYMETGMYLSADLLEHFLYLCLGMYCIDAFLHGPGTTLAGRSRDGCCET